MPALSPEALAAQAAEARATYARLAAAGLKLDMTRGKPSPAQLDLAEGMLALPGNRDVVTEAGEDARNYGGLQGLPEARRLFGAMLGVPPELLVVNENSSLAVMHDCIVWALLKGVPGGTPWVGKDVAFLCPVPGYDRHFALCEGFGIRLIPVAMDDEGPVMEEVERLVADPAVRGMWCVPTYSNPTGVTYSDATVRRLAAMKTAAPDFRLFWDNAYGVHHLTENRPAPHDILGMTAEAGNPDRAFIFASTSKITLAGAGLAFFAGSKANIAWYLEQAGRRTIGPDKLNQLRHTRFLRDLDGIHRHMAAHRRLIAPKFEAVLEALDTRLGGLGLARWTRPEGGYFITVEMVQGSAKRVVELARGLGIALTPAGATSPYGKDPADSVLRLAPTYPTVDEVRAAAEGIALCIHIAALEAAGVGLAA